MKKQKSWSPVTPATKKSTSEPASASTAEPSSRIDTSAPWPTDFAMLSLDEQMQEIIDHIKRMRSELATHIADHEREPHGWKEADKVQSQEGSRGDMTGR